ncbi:hypothetical protein SELMODRAFT_425042 [Selaginella moellendorffii]|uniref:DUF632 domain-containing protein n=1 Tax=Selaginella moellendorffii TaxID=88036 RepID=D8SRU7_SELML|nr:hypothetical protein SELMODRAFT_425042 [Selaginella moellendorffii]
MGHEIHPASSPAHRRLQSPSSPFSAPRRAALSTREEPDLSWRALVYRHQFLLLMLGVLLFLCTVYLYFAITLGTGNSCAGLTGVQKEICSLSSKDKTRRVGARALLTDLNAGELWRKELNLGLCTDAEGADGFSCKKLKTGTQASLEANSGLFDLVFLELHSSRNDHKCAVGISKLVRKGGVLVASIDISEFMQKLNWSFVGRLSSKTVTRARSGGLLNNTRICLLRQETVMIETIASLRRPVRLEFLLEVLNSFFCLCFLSGTRLHCQSELAANIISKMLTLIDPVMAIPEQQTKGGRCPDRRTYPIDTFKVSIARYQPALLDSLLIYILIIYLIPEMRFSTLLASKSMDGCDGPESNTAIAIPPYDLDDPGLVTADSGVLVVDSRPEKGIVFGIYLVGTKAYQIFCVLFQAMDLAARTNGQPSTVGPALFYCDRSIERSLSVRPDAARNRSVSSGTSDAFDSSSGSAAASIARFRLHSSVSSQDFLRQKEERQCSLSSEEGMGCAASKVSKAEDVSRCRARRRLMKQTVASRHHFAATHAAYIQAMKNVGAAFRQFGETELRDAQAAAAERTKSSSLQSPDRPLPPPPPPVFLQDSPRMEFLSPPASPIKTEDHESEEAKDQERRQRKREQEQHQSRFQKLEQEHEGFYYHRGGDDDKDDKGAYYFTAPPPPPVPSSTAPPPPSPPRDSAWEFLDPFRPQEHPVLLHDQRTSKKVENPSVIGSSKRDLAIILLPSGGIGRKDLLDVVKEVDELFLRAYECGKDVSKLLEARKVHYHSNFVDSRGYESHSKRVLQAISLGHRGSSKTPLKVVASEDHLSSPEDSGKAGSHAGTLDSLLAWEKKLYEEVKNTEVIRAEYRKKCSPKLQEEMSDTTRSMIKTLSTKIQVSLQGVDTAISAINKLKEDELHTQLVQLIEGLMNMWNELYDCHQRQHKIASDMKSLDHWGTVEPTTNIHRVATSQLELALGAWLAGFNKLISAQRDYLHNLTGWLRLSNMQLELESARETPGSKKKQATARPAWLASMLQLCLDWSLALDRLPDKVASESIKSFEAVVHKLVDLQNEEVKHRKKLDAVSKEFDKKMARLSASTKHRKASREEQQQQATDTRKEKDPDKEKAAAENDPPGSAEATNEDSNLVESIPSILRAAANRGSGKSRRRGSPEERMRQAVNSIQAKLEEEKERVAKVVFDTRATTINSLHTGLPSIFQAVAGFGRISLHAYQSLYCQAHNGALLRITQA